MPLQLPGDEVHIWITRTDESSNDAMTRGLALLNADEIARADRFHFEADRRSFIVTRTLLRTSLSCYADVRPEDWTFATGAHGKPHMEGPPDRRGIYFNVSHAGGMAVCAITAARVIGVDVEKLVSHSDSLAIADRFFAPSEAQALRKLPEQQHTQAFFDWWTLKESYIKALGLGLSVPLRSFAFDLVDEEAIKVRFEPPLSDHPSDWSFCLVDLAPAHVMAMCAARAHGEPPPRIILRQGMPFTSRSPEPANIRKRSG